MVIILPTVITMINTGKRIIVIKDWLKIPSETSLMTLVTKFQIKIPKRPVASIKPINGIKKFALIFFRRTNPASDIIANSIKKIELAKFAICDRSRVKVKIKVIPLMVRMLM